MTNFFPKEFSDLEPWAAWALKDEPDRYRKRLGSTMEEMQAFYGAVKPRFKDAENYLNQFPLKEMPEPEARLMWLLYSWISVSFPIDVWGQPHVPDSGANDLTGIEAAAP